MILDERDWPVISANARFEEDLICKRALACWQQLTVVVTQNGSFQALHRIFHYYRLHGSHLSSGAGQALFSDSRITRYSKPELAIDVFPPRLY